MEVKNRTAKALVRKMIYGESEGDEASTDEAIAEIRLLTKHDEEIRPLLVESGAIPLLSHHLLIVSSDLYRHSSSSQEDAAAALLNISISTKDPLIATPGFLDGIAAAIRRPTSPAAAQHAATVIYSLLSVETHRPIVGNNRDIVSALISMIRGSNPSRSIKDALKAIYAIAHYEGNRPLVIELGVVPALFSIIVNDGRTGIIEDCTAVVAQIAGCEESLEALVQVSGVCILLDLVDDRTAATERVRDNAAAALLNLAAAGGDVAVSEILSVEGAVALVREMAENGGSVRGKRKAAALLEFLDRGVKEEG